MKLLSIDRDQYEMPDAVSLGLIEGHVCSATEAAGLYQAWCQGLGNNLRPTLKRMKDQGKSPEERAAAVADYAAKYTFASPRSGRDPVKIEALALAKATIVAKLAETGRKIGVPPDGYSADEWAAKVKANIETVAAHADTIKLARKHVADKQRHSTAAELDL